MAVNIDKDACIGCGACVGGCPVGALSLDDEGKSVCDEGTCIDCGSCVGTCWSNQPVIQILTHLPSLVLGIFFRKEIT